MNLCVFCDGPGETKEHILPRWLQKKFSLKDQKLGMMNRTRINYCKVVVPACSKCNSEIFSRLESKVRLGTATDQEYYLWALKIRYCLSIIDSSFPDDRSAPEKGPILHEKFAYIGHEFIKHAFTHLTADRFHFRPFPFGSVIILKNPCNDGDFGFVDVSHPHWSLTIALPNNKVLAVLFTDRGMVKRSINERYKSHGGLKALTKGHGGGDEPTSLFTQILAFHLLVFQYELSNIPYGVDLTKNGIFSKKIPRKPKYREKIKRSAIYEIADYCGLPEEVAEDVYNRHPRS